MMTIVSKKSCGMYLGTPQHYLLTAAYLQSDGGNIFFINRVWVCIEVKNMVVNIHTAIQSTLCETKIAKLL